MSQDGKTGVVCRDLTRSLKLYRFTEAELAAAFTEWDRRYREEPERFEAEAVRLLKGTPESYGERCAPYLIGLLTGTV